MRQGVIFFHKKCLHGFIFVVISSHANDEQHIR